MSTLSEFMEERARAGGERERHHAPSTSHGPVVVLKGWRKGMDKVAVTKLLRSYGLSLTEAHNATEGVLKGESVKVQFREGADPKAAQHALSSLGVVF
jgi:hypothetical protein